MPNVQTMISIRQIENGYIVSSHGPMNRVDGRNTERHYASLDDLTNDAPMFVAAALAQAATELAEVSSRRRVVPDQSRVGTLQSSGEANWIA